MEQGLFTVQCSGTMGWYAPEPWISKTEDPRLLDGDPGATKMGLSIWIEESPSWDLTGYRSTGQTTHPGFTPTLDWIYLVSFSSFPFCSIFGRLLNHTVSHYPISTIIRQEVRPRLENCDRILGLNPSHSFPPYAAATTSRDFCQKFSWKAKIGAVSDKRWEFWEQILNRI